VRLYPRLYTSRKYLGQYTSRRYLGQYTSRDEGRAVRYTSRDEEEQCGTPAGRCSGDDLLPRGCSGDDLLPRGCSGDQQEYREV